jgi:cell wall-associated NlpC family hydrolase
VHCAPRKKAGRLLGTALGVVLTAALTLGVEAGPASAAPQVPSAGDVAKAEAAADAVAAQLAQLRMQLEDAQAAVAGAQAASAIALDDYQAKQADVLAAQAAARAAQAAADQAAADLQAAHDQLVSFVRRSYMQGSTHAGAASLVDVEGPAQLLERAALLDAAGAHRGDQVSTFAGARQQADAADAAAETTLQRAGTLQQQAADALAVAQTEERVARETAAEVAAQQGDLQERLDAARAELVEVVGEQEAAERVRQQEAAAAASRSSRTPRSTVVRTEAGKASGSAVETAIAAASEYLGTQYSWGGGGVYGPGLGIDLDADVVGFDCSGLTQYAYHRAGILIPRNSRAQFSALPKVAQADLQRGDLVFWATDPSDPSTIHHVAIYLGGNKVIQAPESGDVVKISTIWWPGYAGAVRPSA